MLNNIYTYAKLFLTVIIFLCKIQLITFTQLAFHVVFNVGTKWALGMGVEWICPLVPCRPISTCELAHTSSPYHAYHHKITEHDAFALCLSSNFMYI